MAQIGLRVMAVNADGGIFHLKDYRDAQKAAACKHAAQVQKQYPEAEVRVEWGTGHGVNWREVEDRRRNPEKYRFSRGLFQYS